MIPILFKFRVEQHPKPVLLFIKGQLIWAAHGRVITFRVLHDLQKTWKNSTKICKFVHHCRGQMIPILFKFRVEQHTKPVLLFIKGQLIWAAHCRVITFRVLHDLQKTWKNSTKICKFVHHCRGQMIPILFKFRVEQHPKPVLLFIKGQLIWAAHGRVITFRVLHDLQKTWKIAQTNVHFATSLKRPDDTNSF